MTNKINRILLVVQPSLSHYREPFLRELLAHEDLSLMMFGRYSKKTESQERALPRGASDEMLAQVHRIEAKRIGGALIWDQGLVKKSLQTTQDLYVFEGNIYNLTTWLLTIVLRSQRKKVVFWGHGWKRPEAGLKLAIRRVFYSLPNAHFVYGRRAKHYAASVGLSQKQFFPIFNSYASKKTLDKTLKDRNKESSLKTSKDGLTLLFSGRLTKRHGVHRAVQAVLDVRDEHQLDLKLLVVGDGPERSQLFEMTRFDPEAVEFLGPIYSLEELGRIYAKADYAISPGASGLNIIQALSFRVPVIAAEGDPESGPEIEAIQHKTTGLLYPVHDLEALKTILVDIHSEPAELEKAGYVSRGSELLEKHYTSEQHALAFRNAALKVISGAVND